MATEYLQFAGALVLFLGMLLGPYREGQERRVEAGGCRFVGSVS
jgi:hypothetical protein